MAMRGHLAGNLRRERRTWARDVRHALADPIRSTVYHRPDEAVAPTPSTVHPRLARAAPRTSAAHLRWGRMGARRLG